VEFFPMVNELVSLAPESSSFDPTPVPGGPAGTVIFTATLTNTSSTSILFPFFEVILLSGGNQLLNADGGQEEPAPKAGNAVAASGCCGARLSNYGGYATHMRTASGVSGSSSSRSTAGGTMTWVYRVSKSSAC
jgi:hypothetical protein